ncbi:hypothetical protein DDF62_14750 [Caulobacter radicis]|uniref:hypothetical protein n=1 Tax=Caulobacter radicis TaxID=2172650 RepID=UPI000D567E71|nr:hypothetical protein [Caulobacter radicis]PVM88450.1 hypothetical protein DDF62_14750 [Caulobacter radicis]
MTPALEALYAFDLDMGSGRRAAVRLRTPTVSEIVRLALPPEEHTPREAGRVLMLELDALIDTLAGHPPSAAELAAIVEDPERLGALLHVRNTVYDHLALEGRVLALCPHCDHGRAELDLTFYWLALRLPPWTFTDQGVLLKPPLLASPLPSGGRPEGWPRARGFDVFHPDAPGLRALRSLQTPDARVREEEGWRLWAPESDHPPEGREHRRRSPAFLAILRLAVALETTPDVVDGMSVGAFFFLDLLHFALANADVAAPERAAVRCPACDGRFLPVF